jgi:hypothetical protein
MKSINNDLNDEISRQDFDGFFTVPPSDLTDLERLESDLKQLDGTITNVHISDKALSESEIKELNSDLLRNSQSDPKYVMQCDNCEWWIKGLLGYGRCNNAIMKGMTELQIMAWSDFYCKFWTPKELK